MDIVIVLNNKGKLKSRRHRNVIEMSPVLDNLKHIIEYQMKRRDGKTLKYKNVHRVIVC